MSGDSKEDKFQLVNNDELAHDVQPHLGPAAATGASPSVDIEHVNPTLADDDLDNKPQSNGSEQGRAGDSQATGNATEQQGKSSSEVAVASPPVFYSNRTGESTIVQEPVVIRQPNGIHVIRTQQCCELAPHRHVERPLTLRHIKLLKAFSIVSIVIFFPLGIPALYNAHKCEIEFHAGIMRGDMDLCRKLARRVERLLVFSVMSALLVAVAVVAIVERKLNEDNEEYWDNRMHNRVLPTG